MNCPRHRGAPKACGLREGRADAQPLPDQSLLKQPRRLPADLRALRAPPAPARGVSDAHPFVIDGNRRCRQSPTTLRAYPQTEFRLLPEKDPAEGLAEHCDGSCRVGPLDLADIGFVVLIGGVGLVPSLPPGDLLLLIPSDQLKQEV
jgi:hypothetical protein